MDTIQAIQEKQFIFIGGLHRSGTSLTHEIIRTHPDVSGFENTGAPEDEGQHLQSVFQPAWVFGGPGKFGFDNNAFMDENHPLATQDSAKRLFDDWARYWDVSKDFLVEKSPPNIIRTRFLQKLFPSSRFIIVLRHPAALACATQKSSNADIKTLIDHTLICYERFLMDLPYLSRCLVIRYEDLVRDPLATVDGIFDYLDLESRAIEHDIDKNLNEKYFRILEEDNHDVWVRFPFSEYEGRILRLGYSLRDLRSLTPVGFLGVNIRR